MADDTPQPDAPPASHPAPRITCPHCGQTCFWAPQYAGQPVHCACGLTFYLPDDPEGSALLADPPRRRPPADALHPCPMCTTLHTPGLIVCTHCGYDRKTGRRVPVEKEPRPLTPRQQQELIESQKRNRRQLIYTSILLTLSSLGYLVWFISSFEAGFIPALGAYLAWLALGTLSLLGAMWGLIHFADADFGDLAHASFKAAAAYLTVHTARAFLLAAFGLQLPQGGYVSSAMSIIAMLLPLGLAFIIIPIALYYILITILFDNEMWETTIVGLGFYLASSALFVLMKLGGLPG